MGMHTIGFAGENKKGPLTRWTQNPYVFDNSYFKELLLGEKSRYYSSESDHRLVSNPELRHWVEAYAQDQDLFFVNYAKAHVKASEKGHDELMSEFEPDRQVDGGYVERSRYADFCAWLRNDDGDVVESNYDPPVAKVKVDEHHH